MDLFEDYKDHIIGDYKVDFRFSFVIYGDKSPMVCDRIKIDENIYEVESVIDITSDGEREEGLSYGKVTLLKIN